MMFSLCLEAASTSLEEYAEGVCKLAKYIKLGGKLLLPSAFGPADTVFYIVGKEKFIGLSISEKFLTTTLNKTGFCDIAIKSFSCETPGLNIPTQLRDFQYMHAFCHCH